MQDPDDFKSPSPHERSGEVDALALRSESRACLVVVSGKHPGRIFPLSAIENIIGRARDAQVQVQDKAISGKHAKIVAQPDGNYLVDLGSTNGTYLNGTRIGANQPRLLSFNDSVQVAETVFAYLPSHTSEREDMTEQLVRVAPQLPGSTGLQLPDAQVIAQLLQTSALPLTPPEPPPLTLAEKVEKLLAQLRFGAAILKRNWVPLFSSIAFCALAGNASAVLRPPPSEATFSIRITPSTTDDATRNDPKNQRFFTAVEQNFESAALVEQTLREMPPKFKRKTPAIAALNALTFKSSAFMTYDATFTDSDPEYAVAFIDGHLKSFLDFELNRTLKVRQTELDFLTGQLNAREAELQRTEALLKDFKSKHQDSLPELTAGHLESRETLLQRRADLSADLSRTNMELALAKRRMAENAPRDSARVQAAAPYQTSIVEAKRKLSEARAKGLGPEHPEIVSLEKQIKDLERLAETARQTEASALEVAADPAVQALKTRVGDLEVASRAAGAALGEISSMLNRLDNLVSAAPEVEAQYAELTRSYAASKEQYTKLYAQTKESRLKLELERTSALARYEVISPPASSGVPLKKALIQRTVLGIVLGLMVGVVIVAVRELRRLLRASKPRVTTSAIVPAGMGGKTGQIYRP
jgi:uncharacterized protein involved in exopolysaccharide biosynthesis